MAQQQQQINPDAPPHWGVDPAAVTALGAISTECIHRYTSHTHHSCTAETNDVDDAHPSFKNQTAVLCCCLQDQLRTKVLDGCHSRSTGQDPGNDHKAQA